MSTREERIERHLAQIHKREQQFREHSAMADRLQTLLGEWLDEAERLERPERAKNRMHKEAQILLKEIHAGKMNDSDRRFAEAAERVVASTLPKKRVTYLKTLSALGELVRLHTAWAEAETRSKAEQDRMLRQLRLQLLQIEAGHLEELAERFRQATLATEEQE